MSKDNDYNSDSDSDRESGTMIGENCEENPRINLFKKFSFIVLCTNYLSRIFDKNVLTNYNIVSMQDSIEESEQEKQLKIFGSKKDHDYVESIVNTDGCIIIKNISFVKLLEIINILQKLEYCGNCEFNSTSYLELYNSDSYFYNGTEILYVNLDTESG